ncbi:TMEM143 family protein [Phormidium sp. CCY1219]|uniref:TMEM143 family protein n=1 Tax=Phormidium sp. CCY1219 TaxID=2886104 RepID=UPI002D1EA10D|nr:TMEM143 family protein [Phormidium sp. CCY1219]MEB3828075.1 DUF3754 domain-containing protein [Phormidium sp. CCY1219]
MAVYEDREAFIPYRRSDLIELCVEDGKLAHAEVPKFREFCAILCAYYHFEFHASLETLKDNYAPFNPDADTDFRIEPSPPQLAAMESKVVRAFHRILERANYKPLSQANLERAFEEKSLIELKTHVDFDEFDQMVCYCRGDIYKIISVKKWFRNVQQTIDVFERMVLLLKFKNADYFKSKGAKLEKLNFTPGKMYAYYYKNIPKFDLEFLFPNVKTSMTWKDRLLFGIPAIGAAVPLLGRILPQLLLIVGAILVVLGGVSGLSELEVEEEQVRNVMPVLVAMLSLVITLGGFAFKQYTSYKNKEIKFQKNVTETLFFRNLASNANVFQALVDAAEEEECKEIILVYYHLLTSGETLTPSELDDRIETWMDETFEKKIDFDINGPVENLQAIRGKISADGEEVPLLSFDDRGACQVLSLDEAKSAIDYLWDNAFLYTK